MHISNGNNKVEVVFDQGTPSKKVWEKTFQDEKQHEGQIFVSSYNLTGVRNVHIWIDAQANGGTHNGAIQRIFLEFEEPLQPSEHKVPFYDGAEPKNDGSSIERILEIDRHDPIAGILVWETDSCVQAVRFQMKSGLLSEIYGVLHSGVSYSTFHFQAEHPDSKLVGVFGNFGEVLNTIGFKFARIEGASVPSVDPDGILESSVMTRAREEDRDVMMGWAFVISIFMTGALVSLIGRRK